MTLDLSSSYMPTVVHPMIAGPECLITCLAKNTKSLGGGSAVNFGWRKTNRFDPLESSISLFVRSNLSLVRAAQKMVAAAYRPAHFASREGQSLPFVTWPNPY